MSSCLKSALVCHILMACFSLVALPVEDAGLKVDGNPIQVFGKRFCTEGTNVEIVLGNEALKTGNDFRAIFTKVKEQEGGKPEAACPATLTDSAKNISPFSKASPSLPASLFVPKGACDAGVSEGRAVCIYEGGNVTTKLVAQALYRVETKVAKIEGRKDWTAINGMVSFEVTISGSTGGSIPIETCFGKTSDGNRDETPNECPAPHFRLETSNSNKVVINNLENNAEYAFKSRLHPVGENPGDFTEVYTITPVQVAFPLTVYDGEGSKLQFSCQQSTPASIVVLFVVLCLLFLLRFRAKNANSAALLLCVILLKPDTGHGADSTAGTVNIGILGSMYRPDLDSEIREDGSKIFPFYKCFFRKKQTDKEGPINPLMGFEVDWHLWDGFGSLQLGFGAGYTFVQGRALEVDANNNPDCNRPNASSKVSLHMLQITPQVTYIFSPFIEYFPIAPFFRASFIFHGYHFRQGDKTAASVKHGDIIVKPNGVVLGWKGEIGVVLQLDWIDPSSMRVARGQGFLQHVYLKAALSFTEINSFRQRGFQFSAKDIMGTKLPLLWTFGLVFEI